MGADRAGPLRPLVKGADTAGLLVRGADNRPPVNGALARVAESVAGWLRTLVNGPEERAGLLRPEERDAVAGILPPLTRGDTERAGLLNPLVNGALAIVDRVTGSLKPLVRGALGAEIKAGALPDKAGLVRPLESGALADKAGLLAAKGPLESEPEPDVGPEVIPTNGLLIPLGPESIPEIICPMEGGNRARM